MAIEQSSYLAKMILAGSLLCLGAGGGLMGLSQLDLEPRLVELIPPPDVPIYEYPRDAGRNCEAGVFLATGDPAMQQLVVRTGPGENYGTRSALSHGDTFLVFEYRGAWAGIAYGHNRELCGALVRREMRAIHRGWIPASAITYLPGRG